MKNEELMFDEKQYLGTNKQTLSLRLFLSLFCFVAYYYTDIPEVNGDLLFILGVAILFISIVLMFVTHIRLRVDKEAISIVGILGSGKIEIPLNTIINAERIPYSRYIINNPVYNLHRNKVVKFYSGGKDAVKLVCNNDLTYIIGTHKPEELLRVIAPAR